MCVHELVAAQATATPHALAIVARDSQLTYEALDKRANQLDHLLIANGIGREVPVALVLERSPELAIATLAVLKAGGCYVPIDPGYPKDRMSLILEDSAAPLVLTHSSQANRIPTGPWRIISLDAEATEIKTFPIEAPRLAVHPEDLAYIIFTSGSTGRPKGVQITHANLRNLTSWHQTAFQVTASDRAMLQASPGFDASVWELWPYLACGAVLHVVSDDTRSMPERLRDWMVEKCITIGFVPTAMAEALLDLPWPDGGALRALLTGADTLRRHPPAGLPFTLVNNYGPTECTVVATSGIVPSLQASETTPSIGQPIDNVKVYVVDEQMRLVSDGTTGELLIGGAGVSRGYLNNPELTSQKFIPDPFGGAPEARLYRTGDLVRMLPNGEISFCGRIDDQIKIRGYRIEPGEISTALDHHPAVTCSLVTSYSDSAGETRLVAYVVSEPDEKPRVSDLRSFLGRQLPEYMLPATFICVPSLPLTTHGKIDRSALPKPTPENILDDDRFDAPQSEVEQWLASFLKTLLGVERVGRSDNFFTLGGHSLMGAQLIARIDQTFGVELSLRSLFDRPTIKEISLEIESLIHSRLNAMSDEEAQSLLRALPKGIAA